MPIMSNDRFQMKMKAAYISLRGLPRETDPWRFLGIDSEYVQLVKRKSEIPITKATKRHRRLLAIMIFERVCRLGYRRTPNKKEYLEQEMLQDRMFFHMYLRNRVS